MKEFPTLKVRNKKGGSFILKRDSYQPVEPAMYVREAYWEATMPDDENRLFFIYESGQVNEIMFDSFRESNWEDDEQNIGYVPSILRQLKKDEELELQLLQHNS